MSFIIFLAGFMLSSVIWCFLCAGFIGLVRKAINQTGWVLINIAPGSLARRRLARVIHHHQQNCAPARAQYGVVGRKRLG